LKQPWLQSATFDTSFILLPPILATAFVCFLSISSLSLNELPVWGWVIFVLFIDVAHVYSTLYRTYFNKEEFESRRDLYMMVPMFAFVAAIMLHTVSAFWFWRVLAYLAVFHFVRQQYGFMMLYRRSESRHTWARHLDRVVIYLATLYPIAFWHTHLPRQFHWFVDGDFFHIPWIGLSQAMWVAYLATLIGYVCKELYVFAVEGKFNVPKNLVLWGTAVSWYVGIVLLDGDLAFTVTNVVTHGIPYVALVWAYTANARRQNKVWPSAVFGKVSSLGLQAAFFYGLLLGLAYVEEGFWDAFVWREHGLVFPAFQSLPLLTDEVLKSAAVALLILPQLTHYILDGFIWRVRELEIKTS
jgi:hypothetical protein